MKKVNYSKKPTLEQIQRMSFNLREKYGVATSVQIQSFCHSSMVEVDSYFVWVNNIHGKTYNSWKECQEAYFSLIKEKVNE